MRGLVLAGALLGGCVSPNYEDCALSCGSDGSCPQGLFCDGEGWCRVENDGPHCPDPEPTCECDPFAAGCCGAQRACDVSLMENEPFCREITDDGKQASQCQNATQCAVAHTCAAGTCHPFCHEEADCEGNGGACQLEVGAGTLACTRKCNPRDGAGCPAGFGCSVFYSLSRDGGWTDCRAAGAGVTGDACVSDTDCQKGNLCVGGPPGQCARYCRDGHDGDCPEPESCHLLEESLRVAGEAWGSCG